jgi:hypothetical protein
MLTFLKNYLERHQHPVNQALHLIGVPLTFLVSLAFAVQQEWIWAAGCFVMGYLLQFAGHAVEGNDAGETILVKKALGLPYVAVVARPAVKK